jgi:hypothetical protein
MLKIKCNNLSKRNNVSRGQKVTISLVMASTPFLSSTSLGSVVRECITLADIIESQLKIRLTDLTCSNQPDPIGSSSI